jgi:hypothetical protein
MMMLVMMVPGMMAPMVARCGKSGSRQRQSDHTRQQVGGNFLHRISYAVRFSADWPDLRHCKIVCS